MTQSSATITARGTRKSFGEHTVLDDVDLEVDQGTIFALLGPNGAGKTTIVRILSTLLKADAGTATVNGFDVVTQAANVRASISLTGQFAAVDEILTGRENLILVARLRRLKDPGSIADDLLERFQLTDAAARRVATYSGGMRRRLDIAMSLIGNPPVIFLDEPTTGLDPQARIEVWHSVKELAEGRARRCCSPPSTWTRPNTWPTGSRSSTRAGSSPTAPWPSSSSCSRRPRSNTSRSSPPSRRSSSPSSGPPATTATRRQ